MSLIDQGNALEDQGQGEDAIRLYERAVKLAPKLPRAHLNIGNSRLADGDVQGALDAFGAALAIDPKYAAAQYNLGNAYVQAGRHEAALAAYGEAICLKPDFADAEVARGCVLEDLGRFHEAVDSYRRALAINPNYGQVHSNLGNTLRTLGQLDAALDSFRKALEIKPEFAEAHNNLGNVLQDLGDLSGALESYRHAIRLKPDFATAHTSMLFCLSHDEAIDSESLFVAHRRFGEQVEAPFRASWPKHLNVRDTSRRLQIGFVSGDLRDHPVAYFLEPLLLELAESSGLTLHAYYNHAIEGRATPRLRRYFGHWNAVAELTDESLAQKITEDRIDILIDLSGHTAKNRLQTFARKPAPVQASWIGYPGTTGLRAMDYYLADRYFLPSRQFDDQFTEKLVHLPAVAPFFPDRSAPPVNALPALSKGYVTFGSFNRLNKLSPSAIALWSRLLRALPDARMVLGGMPQESSYNALIERFAREDIARERLSFYPRCDTSDYLALHHQVDMCLDTFPYTGGTTTNHALWMGVPTLTLAGHTPASRQGAALLGHVGLEAFVAGDAADFERKGLAWAANLGALADVRAGLRERSEQSSIHRPEVIAAGLESALRTMWQRWCAGLPAESFEVKPTNMTTIPPRST